MTPRLKLLASAVLSALAVAAGGCSRPEPADLVLRGGTIITVDDRQPEAEALAARGDRIVAVGDDTEIARFIGTGTRVVDLQGAVAVPGFIESHAHFLGLGRSRMELDLTTAKSWAEIVDMVGKAVAETPAGAWILGRGWHQEKWAVQPEPNVDGLPYHDALSAVAPDNPVILTHASGHAAIANAAAMARAGIDDSTPSPKGGEIVRDGSGRTVGVFRETAEDALWRALERDQAGRSVEERDAERVRAVELATEACLSHGITTFHDAGASFETIELYRRLLDEGRLGVRLYVMVGEDNETLEEHADALPLVGLGDHRLTVRAVKRLIDGALGSHGAWLLEPYDSLPTSTGLNTEPVEAMRETARIAAEHGLQLCTHAIGDRANRETLDIYEEALKRHPGLRDARWRIEHAQHLSPDDLPRFARLGIVAAMQGIHCTSDAPWVIKRLGRRRAEDGAYMWRSLIDSGAVICNGTDAPVEAVDPIPCLYASMTRRTADGTAFFPDQRMTRQEALRSYTANGAYAAFEEDLKGTLTPGKLADVTVLTRNILTVPEDDILRTEVAMTILGGRVVYSRP